jgi:2-methylcitrate dehydratase PrpD
MPAEKSKRRSDWPAATPAASHSSTIPAPPENAFKLRTRPRAQSGVAAALLTQQGFSGPADIIEGNAGFARAYADGWDPAIIESGLGERFHLMDVLVKSHAAAARVAAAIDGMLSLRQQHGFNGDDIKTARLGIPRVIAGRLTNPHPVDLQAAQMCLPFSVALASKIPMAADFIPAIAVADYEAGLADRSLFELEERTTIDLDDEVEAASNELSTAARVSVELRDGRKLSAFVAAPKGSPSGRSPRKSTKRASRGNCRSVYPRKSVPTSSVWRKTSTRAGWAAR